MVSKETVKSLNSGALSRFRWIILCRGNLCKLSHCEFSGRTKSLVRTREQARKEYKG